MKEIELKKSLIKKGYNVYVWSDKPNEHYKSHNHPYDTKLIILRGSMKLTMENRIFELKPGKEFYIKAKEMHGALIGKEGCRYLVGEKIK